MKKVVIALWCLCGFGWISAQKDSIYIEGEIASNYQDFEIKQEIKFHNSTQNPIKKIQLLNWIASYSKNSKLYHRELEDRNRELHFAKPEQLGKLKFLKISENASTKSDLNSENIHLDLHQALQPNESITLQLEYTLQLPHSHFTGYGVADNTIAVKYFFLVPDSFSDKNPYEKKYLDVEETSNYNTHWTVKLEVPVNHFSKSNLPEIYPNYFQGTLKNDPEILISAHQYPKINASVNGKRTEVTFGYSLTAEEKIQLEYILPKQLAFIQNSFGFLPEKIFISDKFRKKEDFFGNEDITFWKFRFPLFTFNEKLDLDYISIISQNVLEQSFVTYKEEDHWLKNGLKSYLEIQYIKSNYPNHKLLGMLPETSVFGVKPLKIFNASQIKLLERYGIAYQYIMTENADQQIHEKYSHLSNLNDMIISKFEMGTLFNFVAEKMGENKFNEFIKHYFTNSNSQINIQDFLEKLALETEQSSAFLKKNLHKKHRVNFNLNRFDKNGNKLNLRISKNTPEAIPLQIQTLSSSGDVKTYWYDTPENVTEMNFEVDDTDVSKITLNNNYLFPESNFRDNYLYTKGLFSNMKKPKFKLFTDIPNPEYHEIYLEPRLTFNAYDNVLLGMNFRNESLFQNKFTYSLTPYYSSGTGKVTGSSGFYYNWMPSESFFNSLLFGINGSYFHYDYHLAYQKASASAQMSFTKDPRTAISRYVTLSYNHYQRELTPKMIAQNDYDRYNLWNLNYRYSDNSLIHEKFVSSNFQMMEDFYKISAEALYRYEYAPHRKISVRLFGGYFIKNKSRNETFDFGISKVSNYSFSYGLLGQSATSGFLSQQYILADAGFKSLLDTTANQWITSANVDTHIWKLFHLYADAGVYKNTGKKAQFIWDSGVNLRIIPDFVEVYLPVYSSLGFEPSFKDYASRIRFSLVLDLGAIVNSARRGWY